MPGAFYTRAFIKQIADTVGLDGAALLEEHASEIPQAVVKYNSFYNIYDYFK